MEFCSAFAVLGYNAAKLKANAPTNANAAPLVPRRDFLVRFDMELSVELAGTELDAEFLEFTSSSLARCVFSLIKRESLKKREPRLKKLKKHPYAKQKITDVSWNFAGVFIDRKHGTALIRVV